MSYVSLEYLIQNEMNPEGIEYKGVFGNRSIGKTHGVLKYLVKNRKKGTAIMLLRRKQNELNFAPFVEKYGSAFGVPMKLGSNVIMDDEGEIIFYYDALSLAERGKHKNYDTPYVTDIVVDEVYAENPNKNEFQQLQTWITTLSRHTGAPFHPVRVWLLGNNEYGISPIMEELGIYSMNGQKQKRKGLGVFYFSKMESPSNVINVKSNLIKEVKIREGNLPIITWSFKKQSFGLYDCGTYLYIQKEEKSKQAYDMNVKMIIARQIVRKRGIPPIYAQDYDCLRFVQIAGDYVI